MNASKRLALVMVVVLALTLLPTVTLAQGADPLALPAPTGTVSITVDGAPLTLTVYRAVYVANPVPVKNPQGGAVTSDYETMNIYVPSNATADSPMILQVSNSGWMPSKVPALITNGTAYVSATNQTGAAFKAGYVIAAAGTRSRTLQDMSGNYVGHAPAVVVDAKAAIRYLRYNDAALMGTAKRIFITGTSGGGGLSVAISASGNSPDYFPYLQAIGAAGVSYNPTSGQYASSLKDDVFGTVAYCPITDLNNADAAYEWLYNNTRYELGTYSADQMAASDWLKNDYVMYFNKLGLRDPNRQRLVAANLAGTITRIVEKEIEEAYVEVGPVQMAADIDALPYKDHSWYSIDANGKATLDLDKYLLFIVKNQALKTPPAFDNYKSVLQGQMNESNLAGTASQEYSPFSEWSWEHNGAVGDGVGSDDVGLPWDAFVNTDAGKAVMKQMNMIDPIPYLLNTANGDNAPYWYYRHGMRDRDTSFPVEVAMYYAILNAGVSNVNFELAWLKPHQGNYDVPEAYEWVAEAVENGNTFDTIGALLAKPVTQGFALPSGPNITYTSSNEAIFKVVNGQAVVTQPARTAAKIVLTVRVVSDKVAGNGYNYSKVDVTRAFTFTVVGK